MQTAAVDKLADAKRAVHAQMLAGATQVDKGYPSHKDPNGDTLLLWGSKQDNTYTERTYLDGEECRE